MGQSDVILLGVGRHIKIRKGLKLICGRNEPENLVLGSYLSDRLVLRLPGDRPGPTVLVDQVDSENVQAVPDLRWPTSFEAEELSINEFILNSGITLSSREILIAASITARYATTEEKAAEIEIVLYDSECEIVSSIIVNVAPFNNEPLLKASLITAH